MTEREKFEAAAKEVREATLAYQKVLKKYPVKGISEYTRLVDQIDEFLSYGSWSYYREDEDEG